MISKPTVLDNYNQNPIFSLHFFTSKILNSNFLYLALGICSFLIMLHSDFLFVSSWKREIEKNFPVGDLHFLLPFLFLTANFWARRKKVSLTFEHLSECNDQCRVKNVGMSLGTRHALALWWKGIVKKVLSSLREVVQRSFWCAFPKCH